MTDDKDVSALTFGGAGAAPSVGRQPWRSCERAPDNRVVLTKIDDGQGARNHQALKRSGNLWYVPDGSMYVYYRPTHWRELTDTEREVEIARARTTLAQHSDSYTRTFAALAKPEGAA